MLSGPIRTIIHADHNVFLVEVVSGWCTNNVIIILVTVPRARSRGGGGAF